MQKVLLLLMASMIIVQAKSQWNSDTTQNNPICITAPTTQKTGLVAAPDGNGGMYLAWEDSRNTATASDIYIQRVRRDGTLQFGVDGLLVTDATGSQNNIAMTDDGAGGVILVWLSNQTNNRNDVYGQRINAAGTALWTANGVPVADTTGLQTSPTLARVNASEAVVFFRSDIGATSGVDLYTSKINTTNGAQIYNRLIANGANTQSAQLILPDSTGGAFLVWQDPRAGNTNSDIYAQRINNAGDTLWSDPANPYNGLLVCNAANNQLAPAFTYDGAGGIVITWGDLRTNTSDPNIYAQRVSSAGVTQWGTNGKLITAATGPQTNAQIMKLSGFNWFIFWSDQRVATNNRDIYIQKVNATGDTLFTGVSGKAVVTQTGNQPVSANSATFVSDSANGIIIIWDDARYGLSAANALDIRAQRLNNNGDPLWMTDGVPVSTRAGSNQINPVAVSDGAGGAIIAWQDSRTSTNGEIYGSRLFGGGALPVEFITIKAAQNKNSITVNWEASCDNLTDHFSVEKSVDARTFNTIGSVKANINNGRCLADFAFEDNYVSNGINYYRIKGVDKDGKFTYSTIAKVIVNGKGSIAVQLYPNPVASSVNLQLTNFNKGKYQITIADLSGKTLQASALNVQLAFQQTAVSLPNLAKGVYVANVIDEKGAIVANKQFVKQ